MSRNELSKKEQELFAAAVECTSNDSEKEVLSSVLGSITVSPSILHHNFHLWVVFLADKALKHQLLTLIITLHPLFLSFET